MGRSREHRRQRYGGPGAGAPTPSTLEPGRTGRRRHCPVPSPCRTVRSRRNAMTPGALGASVTDLRTDARTEDGRVERSRKLITNRVTKACHSASSRHAYRRESSDPAVIDRLPQRARGDRPFPPRRALAEPTGPPPAGGAARRRGDRGPPGSIGPPPRAPDHARSSSLPSRCSSARRRRSGRACAHGICRTR